MTKKTTPPADPATALQRILEENARLKEQNRALLGENDQLSRENGALRMQIGAVNDLRTRALRIITEAHALEAVLPSIEPRGARLDDPIWSVLTEAHMTHWAANGIRWRGIETLRELVSQSLPLLDKKGACVGEPLGPRRQKDINTALAPFGLHLGMTEAEIAAYEALFVAPKT